MYEAAARSAKDPVIVPVYTPRGYIEAGQRLMRELYERQEERRRIEQELRESQAACAALFSAG